MCCASLVFLGEVPRLPSFLERRLQVADAGEDLQGY
jgi:hypothetical protein